MLILDWMRNRVSMMLNPLAEKKLSALTFEETATGYAIAAMRMAEVPPDTSQQVVVEMRIIIDKFSAAEAAQIATSSPY